MKLKRDDFLNSYIIPISICLLVGVGVYQYGNYKSSREYYQEGLKMVKKKDFYNASLYLEGAIHYDNSYQEAYLLHAKIYVNELKDYQFGLDILNTALAETEGNGVLFYLKGYCNYKLSNGNISEAIRNLELAKKINPEIDSIYFLLGKIYQLNGTHDQSVINLNEAIERYPKNAELYFLKGKSLLELEKTSEAIENFSKSILLKKSGEVYYYRGFAYKASGNTLKACEDFANANSNDFEEARNAEKNNCL